MTNSNEPVKKDESSDDESIDLQRCSGYKILEHAKRSKPSMLDSTAKVVSYGAFERAKRKYAERHGGGRWKWSMDTVLPIVIQIGPLMMTIIYTSPMLVDPLFLYAPIIDENIKCLTLDKNLKKTSIILRVFTDLPYLVAIIKHGRRTFGSPSRNSNWWRKAGRLFRLEFLIGIILPVLPIPQIVILIILPRTKDSKSLNRIKFFNSLILLQYVPRAVPVYQLCNSFNKSIREYSNNTMIRKILWIPRVFYFIVYIFASHVLGAFWYFYSVQREIDCWISTCRKENGCDLRTLQCDNTTFRNVTLLNDLCPTNPPNPVVFDFGIFADALQSGIVRTTNFSQKLFMCFSWGLRNLSSFASNLNTSSSYAWETLFVIFIAISGLVLFIYLLGHLQTFIQATSRTYSIWQRRTVIFPQICSMLSEYGIPDDPEPDSKYWGGPPGCTAPKAEAIWELVSETLEEDEYRPVENIFSLLPSKLKKHLKRHLFLDTLKKVPGLENQNRKVLKEIMEHLEPVNYADGSYIIRDGEPLDRMLFITQGSVLTYKTSSIGGESGSSSIKLLAKSEFYGEELIRWAAPSTSFSNLPISAKTVKSHTKVEVFVLMADHLQRVVSKFPDAFNTEPPQPADSSPVEISIS